ncbi:hypothetical protein Ciccas_002558 [Cichlidogyrus casuarinus]|uniref:Dendritic cell-specific transmembrane protein-like domain-containing protein n=1 Tax=Cichlidogyrus casuarinus TaxID=1844966 RepID=A0ABD2QGW7_9PLAT
MFIQALISCAPDIKVVNESVYTMFLIISIVLVMITLFRVGLLRMRHLVAGFALPEQELRRINHLYNQILISRSEILAIKRGTFVQTILDRFAVPKEASKRFRKCVCCICHDKCSVNDPRISICVIDRLATCQNCLRELDLPNETCIGCLVINDDKREILVDKLEKFLKDSKATVEEQLISNISK